MLGYMFMYLLAKMNLLLWKNMLQKCTIVFTEMTVTVMLI